MIFRQIVKERKIEFEPVTFEITFESVREMRVFNTVLGCVDGEASILTYDLFTRLKWLLMDLGADYMIRDGDVGVGKGIT